MAKFIRKPRHMLLADLNDGSRRDVVGWVRL